RRDGEQRATGNERERGRERELEEDGYLDDPVGTGEELASAHRAEHPGDEDDRADRRQRPPGRARHVAVPGPLPRPRREQRRRGQRGDRVVLETRRGTREEEEQTGRPRPEEERRARGRGGDARRAARALAERQRDEHDPWDGAPRPRRPEERERVPVG